MKLYDFELSPNCQKVLALAAELGTPLEIIPLDVFKGQARTPAMIAKNPNGKLPVLEDEDFVLWESNAILVYLATKAGRTDLAPTTLRERADVDRWLSWGGVHFAAAVRKVAVERIVKKLAGLGPADQAKVKEGTEEFASAAAVLDRCLEDKEYLCGTLTVADFGLAPYAAVCPTAGLSFEPYPNAQRWLRRMLDRKSMRREAA